MLTSLYCFHIDPSYLTLQGPFMDGILVEFLEMVRSGVSILGFEVNSARRVVFSVFYLEQINLLFMYLFIYSLILNFRFWKIN